jgi:Cu-Zn family superoxide dismutase
MMVAAMGPRCILAPANQRAVRAYTALLLGLLPSVASQATSPPYRAIARVHGATGIDSNVFGSVIFEQQTALGDVTVRVEIEGLRPGFHGFHVHQYGDVRSTSDLTTISAHFVPYCAPPNIDENGQQVGGCEEDQVHGLPPNATRQPGDMGNLEVGPDGSLTQASRVLTIGQSKMSLSDPLRSIIGRTILIHAERDDGSQPYGNAGGPEAYGVIGLASTPVGGSNNAQAPQIPHVTKVICTFQSDSSTPINPTLDGQPTQIAPGSVGGSALLQLMEPHQPGVVRMQARLLGLTRHSTHSFHFHSWGDMTVGLTNGALGPIYAENAIVVEHVEARALAFPPIPGLVARSDRPLIICLLTPRR